MILRTEDRYTVWDNDHGVGLFGKDICTRLAQYEDTGFTPEELEGLKVAVSENRILILPVKVGDVIWICDYAVASNRMIPIQTRMNSFTDIINLMFGNKQWFTTLEDAWKYLDDLYKDDEK